MKQLTRETMKPGMTAALGGAFYPTGHSVLMFAEAGDAEAVARALPQHGFSACDIYLIPPDAVISLIGATAVETDVPLPSAGTEAATARAYVKLAHEGQTGLMVATPDAQSAERMMQEVRKHPYSMAQRYRKLVIEDL